MHLHLQRDTAFQLSRILHVPPLSLKGPNERPESLLRIRYPAKKLEDQATQTRKGGHAMISSIKAEIPRLRITEQLPTSTKVPRLKAKIEEVPREF